MAIVMILHDRCSDVQRLVRTGSEVVIVPKVSAEVVNVHVLLLAGNVILMFAEIAGSGEMLKLILGFRSNFIKCFIFIFCDWN